LGEATDDNRQNEYASPTTSKPAKAHSIHMNHGVCLIGITGGGIATARYGRRASLERESMVILLRETPEVSNQRA
jgi:hypothetical protein